MDYMTKRIVDKAQGCFVKSVKDMTLEEKIQLCIDYGYDVDGDVHNGEAFFVIHPDASITERKKLFEIITGCKLKKIVF